MIHVGFEQEAKTTSEHVVRRVHRQALATGVNVCVVGHSKRIGALGLNSGLTGAVGKFASIRPEWCSTTYNGARPRLWFASSATAARRAIVRVLSDFVF